MPCPWESRANQGHVYVALLPRQGLVPDSLERKESRAGTDENEVLSKLTDKIEFRRKDVKLTEK